MATVNQEERPAGGWRMSGLRTRHSGLVLRTSNAQSRIPRARPGATAGGKIRGRHLGQLIRGVGPSPCIAVARQVNEIEAPSTRPASPAINDETEDVRQPGLARGRARARHLAPDERVQQRRFADVGSPCERDLTESIGWNAGRVATRGGARDEIGLKQSQLSGFGDPGFGVRGSGSESQVPSAESPSPDITQCVIVSSLMAG